MAELSHQEEEILIQHAIKKYKDEQTMLDKLSPLMPAKSVQRHIDTLLGTQRVRRIGPETLENNESHTEMPDLPERLRQVLDGL